MVSNLAQKQQLIRGGCIEAAGNQEKHGFEVSQPSVRIGWWRRPGGEAAGDDGRLSGLSFAPNASRITHLTVPADATTSHPDAFLQSSQPAVAVPLLIVALQWYHPEQTTQLLGHAEAGIETT